MSYQDPRPSQQPASGPPRPPPPSPETPLTPVPADLTLWDSDHHGADREHVTRAHTTPAPVGEDDCPDDDPRVARFLDISPVQEAMVRHWARARERRGKGGSAGDGDGDGDGEKGESQARGFGGFGGEQEVEEKEEAVGLEKRLRVLLRALEARRRRRRYASASGGVQAVGEGGSSGTRRDAQEEREVVEAALAMERRLRTFLKER